MSPIVISGMMLPVAIEWWALTATLLAVQPVYLIAKPLRGYHDGDVIRRTPHAPFVELLAGIVQGWRQHGEATITLHVHKNLCGDVWRPPAGWTFKEQLAATRSGDLLPRFQFRRLL